MNRRDFSRTLAAGAGSLALGAPTFIRNLRPKDKVGIALVGLGYYSRDLLAPALQETEHAYLAGIVTGTPAKATRWKAQYGIPDTNIYNYETYEGIANNPDIDAI